MARAEEALERLSADPAAQALYEARLKGRMFLQVVREEGREEGRVEGRQEGRAEGRQEGRELARAETLREAIGWLCDSLAIPLDDALRARLTSATVPELEAIAETLRTTKVLPPA